MDGNTLLKLPVPLCERRKNLAIFFMYPDATYEQVQQLSSFIDEQLDQHKICWLDNLDQKFRRFVEFLGLDSQVKRVVVITPYMQKISVSSSKPLTIVYNSLSTHY